MGKYMRKSKFIAEVSSIEKSKSTLGVHTRAKTLALQRLQASKPDYCYLQLRSRRLEKPILKQSPKVKESAPETQTQNSCSINESGSRTLGSGSFGSAQVAVNGFEGLEDENFGENDLSFEPIESSGRESTPCNLITSVEISTPSSSTRYPSSTAETQGPRIPSTREVDEIFAHYEQQQQHLFMQKYNFDIINDMPLPGRYEWVKVNP